MRRSVDKGRRAERGIALRLTRWAAPFYRFERRGLGHKSAADLLVTELVPIAPAWPFPVSIKAQEGPSLPAMLASARNGGQWPWWQEIAAISTGPVEWIPRAWLVWKSRGVWMLSVGELLGVLTPPRFAVLPNPRGWPRYTLLLEDFLVEVKVEDVVRALRAGEQT